MNSEPSEFPDELKLSFEKAETLRYGENPHQGAALYLNPNDTRIGVARAKKVQGKELSYNNYLDADAAFECVAEFTEPTVVIVKHTNPCGVAEGVDMKDAYVKALACDPISAFGGIVALNRSLEKSVAEELAKIFLEVIVAPDASPEALAVFAAKPSVRILLTGTMPGPRAAGIVMRSITGGMLVQNRDEKVFADELKVVTKRAPTPEEMKDLEFAFTVAKHVKSNAIVYAKGGATLGVGAGQMSRIYSAKLAAIKAGDAHLPLAGSVLASDAFMPFPDVVEEARKAGATAIIQPGGSLKDQDSIDAADAAGMAMVFTGIRHFRH